MASKWYNMKTLCGIAYGNFDTSASPDQNLWWYKNIISNSPTQTSFMTRNYNQNFIEMTISFKRA